MKDIGIGGTNLRINTHVTITFRVNRAMRHSCWENNGVASLNADRLSYARVIERSSAY
jgi:hypothetical protein